MNASTASAVVLAALLLFNPSFNSAATAQSRTQPQPPAAKPKEPPPPLFPKHRRGIYTTDNVEFVDATPQSPPLEIDDPGVPDKGEFEINLLTAGDFSSEERKLNLFHVDANYGIVLKIGGHEVPSQLKFEAPFSGVKPQGEPFAFGVGQTKVGVKLNFSNNEDTGVAFSVYPQIGFAPSGSADKGLAERGSTFELPVLISKQVSVATIVINAGIEQPFADPERRTTATFGFGMGRALMRKFAVMAEIHGESTFDFKDQREAGWNAGVIYGVRNIPVYAAIGHTLFSEGGGGHTNLTFGVKVTK